MQDTPDAKQNEDTNQAIIHQSEEHDLTAREATELGDLAARNPQRINTAAVSDKHHGYLWSLSEFWKRQVAVIEPHEKAREYLALERTYLAYIRTSVAISMAGVTVAQAFRLQHSLDPNPSFGFFAIGVPLGCACQVVACALAIIGAHRYWRQQNAMVRGKVRAGGWEIWASGLAILLLTLVLFALLLGVDISKDV